MNARPVPFFGPEPGVQAPAPSQSLLERAAAAPDFFGQLDADTQESILRRERAGEYTAARLFSQKPALYREIVLLLGDGLGLKVIAKRLSVSPNTVRAVRKNEPAAVDTSRIKTVGALVDFVHEAAERFRDEGHEIPINQLGVPFGIAVEKMQLLSGGATQRVEVVDVSPIDDWNAYVAGLPSANPLPMGLSEGNSEQKGGLGVAGLDGSDEGRNDGPSLVPGSLSGSSAQDATLPATSGPGSVPVVENVSQQAEGGRGSAKAAPPAISPIHCGERETETKGAFSDGSGEAGVSASGLENLAKNAAGGAGEGPEPENKKCGPGGAVGAPGAPDFWESMEKMSAEELRAFAREDAPSTTEFLKKNGGGGQDPAPILGGKPVHASGPNPPPPPLSANGGGAPDLAAAGNPARRPESEPPGGLATPPSPALPKKGRLVCGFCGGKAQGLHFTDSLGNGEGVEVALCNECGGESGPAMSVIWDAFRLRGPYEARPPAPPENFSLES